MKAADVAAGAALTPGMAAGIAEDGESFVPIPDTEDTNAVVGQEQPDL